MTSGSRSSPASTRAGSPGSSCCSPKMMIETKTTVGTAITRRRMRKASMAAGRSWPDPAGRVLLELEARHAHEPVRKGREARELLAEAVDPAAVVKIDDRQV